MKARQTGITSVEFAIVASVLFLLIFGVMEVGRAMMVWGTLTEMTRRGARVATICPVNDAAIKQVTLFNSPNGGDPVSIIKNLGEDDIQLDYLDEDGTVIGDPGANYYEINYVRVSIPNYQHQLLIPGMSQLIDAPEFETTLPRESLGVSRQGASARCFGG